MDCHYWRVLVLFTTHPPMINLSLWLSCSPYVRVVRPLVACRAARLDGCVTGSLFGNHAYQRDHSVVIPLLRVEDDLPFVVALEVLVTGPRRGPTDVTQAPPKVPGIYELRFVLAGSGVLRHLHGAQETIGAGDTVLAAAGSVHVDLEGPSAGDGLAACLVVLIPRSLLDTSATTTANWRTHVADSDMHALKEASSYLWNSEMRVIEGGRLPATLVYNILTGAKDMLHPERERDKVMPDSHSTNEEEGNESWLNMCSIAIGIFFAKLRDAVVLWDRPFPTVKRTLEDLTAFELPNQTNRLALVFDPFMSEQPPVPFVFGVEIFEAGHRTTPHVHPNAHEVFFLLSGEGEAFCGGERFFVNSGDIVAFRPGAVHGIDNIGAGKRIYCLELMLPNENFAEFVRAGRPTGALADEDLCILARIGCK